MISSIGYCSPTEEEMNRIVKEWWEELDNEFEKSGRPPAKGVRSADMKYAYLYGHYDMIDGAAGAHKGEVRDYRDLRLLAPLVNGRYGIGKRYKATPYGDETTGILLSQYATELYANILRGDRIINIPQVHWITHELPKAHELNQGDGFYYGVWICIDGKSLEQGDTLMFGGKGGPHVASLDKGASLDEKSEWLQRFETHAIWRIL